jgi:hypothetical protein
MGGLAVGENIYIYKGNQDNAVGIAVGYRLDNRGIGVRVPVGDNIFLFHVIETSFGVHPAS